MKNQQPMIEKMRKLVTSNESARKIFQWAAGRDKNSVATGLDRLVRKVKLDKDEAVAALEEFEKIGLGTYIIGRRGGKTRFEWAYGLVTVGLAALGKSDAMEVMGSPGDDEGEEKASPAPRIPASSATESRRASETRAMSQMGASLLLAVPNTLSAAKLKQIQEILAS